MSSIDASERSRYAEEAKRQREEYETQQANAAKKQRKEVRKLTENQDQNLQSVQDYYESQIKNLKDENRNVITKRDRQYQEKMESMRSMYADQLKRKIEEQGENQDRYKTENRAAFERQKIINEQQQNNMRSQFGKALDDVKNSTEDHSDEARVLMQAALNERTRKVNEKTEREKSALIADTEKRLSQVRQDLENVKRESTGRSKQDNRQTEQKLSTIDNNWRRIYDARENEFGAIMKDKNIDLQEARNRMSAKYENALKTKLSGLDEAFTRVKDSSYERYINDVKDAENNTFKARQERVVDIAAVQKQAEREKKNLVAGYEEQVDLVQNQKTRIHDASQEISNKRINKIIDQTQGLLQKQTRESRQGQNLAKTVFKQDRELMVNSYESQLSQEKNTADKRIRNIVRGTEADKQAYENYFKENLSSMKGDFSDTLTAQRENQIATSNDMYLRMDKRLKDDQRKSEMKMETLVDNYERKLSSLEDNYKKELKRQEEIFAARDKNTGKQQKMELDSQGMKFETKMAQLKEDHARDLERIEKKHQEQVQSLANRVNQSTYSRRA